MVKDQDLSVEVPETKPEVTFLYMDHDHPDIDTIWGRAREFDILLIENVGGTEEFRRQEEAGLLTAQSQGQQDVIQRLVAFYRSQSSNEAREIIARALENGIEVRFIDAAIGQSGYDEHAKSDEQLNLAWSHIEEGNIEEAFV